jgi:hypothetical protein
VKAMNRYAKNTGAEIMCSDLWKQLKKYENMFSEI